MLDPEVATKVAEAAKAPEIPWGEIIAGFGAAFTVINGAVAWIVKNLITDRIKAVEADRDEWKKQWKDLVKERRNHRRMRETEELGAPSVAPPPDDSHIDDTRRIRIIEAQDAGWEEERQREMLRRRAEDQPRTPPLAGFGGGSAGTSSKLDAELKSYMETKPPVRGRRS